MPGDMVKIIIDRVYNKIVPKPINLRPGYDMEHVFNYRPQTDNYRYEKVVEIEKQYDYLSIIRPHETPQQWLIMWKVLLETNRIPKLLGKYGISELPEIFFSRNFPRLYHLPIIEYMSSQPNFNEHYKNLFDQLPPFMKKDAWLHLTTRKNNPLSEEQAKSIHSDIEELLTREVDRYFNKKNCQKIKIEANTFSDGSSTLSWLDGFEKQLEEHEYDALKSRLESEYNNCMHNSHLAELEKQYKSHISALDKANAIKDKEIGKLSSTISQLMNEKWDIKKTADSVCKDLEDIIFTKDLKIIALNDRVIFSNPSAGSDGTIEPNTFISFHDAEYWTRKREDAKNPTLTGCELILDSTLSGCRFITHCRLAINPAFSFFMT
ncbi:hypothetical protein RhiirA5_417181 [Rhizophagus irregularis]|uniref:Uncharacterized protein n=1 Tax=Rhizophagus irregularis TaxID=588596 RepID=A0A2N0PN64_9GLOM|nr:hypothetical protein RhiirA5_417181 [Rhizophagus irregularis]